MLAGCAALISRRRSRIALLSVLLVCLLGGRAEALGIATGNGATSVDYEVRNPMLASIWSQDPFPFFVTKNLRGNISLSDSDAIDFTPGEILAFDEFTLSGSGSLCDTCGRVDIDIMLDPTAPSSLTVAQQASGVGATGQLSLLLELSGVGAPAGGVTIAAEAQAVFPSPVNGIGPAAFFAVYRFTSLEITDFGEGCAPAVEGKGEVDCPELDLSNIGHLQFAAKQPEEVPEPTTGLFLAMGLGGYWLASRRRAPNRAR